MAIPTPKTPANRNQEMMKSNNDTNKKNQKSIPEKQITSKPIVKKPLPTPPSRASHHATHAKKKTSSTDMVSTIISFLIIVGIAIGLWMYK